MPMLGLGVWQIQDGTRVEQAVEWALEAGYRHIDTATLYRNESGVGAALRRSGIPRTELFVTTKWLPLRRGPRVELGRSLERLGLEYVDLYLIHWPVPGRIRWAWRELERLQRIDKTRAIGVSNFTLERLIRLTASAKKPPVVNQVHFSPTQYQAALLEYCTKNGIVLEAYSPLDRGELLSNETVIEMSRRLNQTPAQILLRWCIQHRVPVIPKSGQKERIQSNSQIFDFELSDDDMRALDTLKSRS